jgi:midasin (ATPase involved in ribosome maturation)
MLNLAEVAYGGLTQAESKVFEQITWSTVTTCRSSILSELCRETTKKNFGKLTLCSHKEKVGIVYYLLLALHDKHGRSIFEQAQTRQKTRYSTFPSRKRIKEWQDVNNKGKATKRRKATNEVGASFCELMETPQGNDDDEEEELPSLLCLTVRTCYLEQIITTKSHLIVKTSQLSLFVTTSIVMGLGFFFTRTLMRFSWTYS